MWRWASYIFAAVAHYLYIYIVHNETTCKWRGQNSSKSSSPVAWFCWMYFMMSSLPMPVMSSASVSSVSNSPPEVFVDFELAGTTFLAAFFFLGSLAMCRMSSRVPGTLQYHGSMSMYYIDCMAYYGSQLLWVESWMCWNSNTLIWNLHTVYSMQV